MSATAVVPPATAADEVTRLVGALIERTATFTWAQLDADTQSAARALVLDALGLAAAAPAAPSLAATSLAFGRVAGSSSVDSGVHVPFWGSFPGPGDAASALSVAIHAWDFDDTHDDAVVHTACVAVPAALATAQECGGDGRRVLEGVVAGVEVISRLGLALGPQYGVIRTAGLGALAAAASSAHVLGLDRESTRAALSLALSAALAPTSRQVVSDSAVNKRHQPSLAVRSGLTAAYLAAEGIEGPVGWWSGEYGLGRAVTNPELATHHLSAPGWEVTRVSLKPIPACRYTHAAVAGVLELTGGRRVSATQAPDVAVHLPVGSTHEMVARPYARRGLPIVDAQFSVPWLVAAALLRGRVGLLEMTDTVLRDGDIEDVARRRVTCVQDQELGAGVMTPVVVDLTDDNGQRSLVVERLHGSPERPLTPEEQRVKLLGCLAVAGRSADAADTLADLVADLENLSAVPLGRRLRADTPAARRDQSDRKESLDG